MPTKCEELLAEQDYQREANRLRQAKFREKHKAEISKQRKEKRKRDQAKIANCLAHRAAMEAENNAEEVSEPDPEDETAPTLKKKRIFHLTVADALTRLANLTRSDFTLPGILFLMSIDRRFSDSAKTAETYAVSAKRIFDSARINNLLDICKTIPVLNKKLALILKGTQTNGKKYAANSLKITYAFLGLLFDYYVKGVPNLVSPALFLASKIRIKSFLNEQKEVAADENADKMLTQEVPTFDQYEAQLRAHFKAKKKDLGTSDQWLLFNLYRQFTVRDNFWNMSLVYKPTQMNLDDNFLLISGTGTNRKVSIIIHHFKTNQLYEDLNYHLDKNLNAGEKLLKKLILDRVDRKKMVLRSLLFGKSPLSSKISAMNDSIFPGNGYGGSNLFRHMKVASILARPTTYAEREAEATRMGHSIFTQKLYDRVTIKTSLNQN